MDQGDYEAFYRHVRAALQVAGRGDLDVRIVESQRLNDSRGSSEDVESYLLALRQEMILESAGAARRTMEVYRNFQSPTGTGVTGIVVDIQDQDRASFGDIRTVELVGSTALDELVGDLEELLSRVREDRASG